MNNNFSNYTDSILSMKKTLTNMLVAYNSLSNSNSIEKRKEHNQEQINSDYYILTVLRNDALDIFDKCNKILCNIGQ